MGRPEKISFEYEFIQPKNEKEPEVKDKLDSTTSSTGKSGTEQQEKKVKALTDLLSRLLDVSKSSRYAAFTSKVRGIY